MSTLNHEPSQYIHIGKIAVPERLRGIDDAWVQALAASIEETGLEQAIVVRPIPEKRGRTFELVAGAHRLQAIIMLEWPEIECKVRDLSNNEARLVEIDENLMRRELDQLDRAEFLHERKKVYEELHPETKHGGDRKLTKVEQIKARDAGEDIKSPGWRLEMGLPRFSADVADRIGLGERTIQRCLMLAERLSPDVKYSLRGTPLANNQSALLALCEEEPEVQLQIAEKIRSGDASGIGPAKAMLGLSAPVERDEQARIQTQLVSLWGKADKRVRKAFRAHIEGAK